MEWYKVDDIKNIFTLEVRDYLTKGYVFHDPRSLGNELLKVDIEKGNECIRFLLEHEHTADFADNGDFCSIDKIILTIGSYDIKNRSVWTKDLKVIKKLKFFSHNYDYATNDGFFVTDMDLAIALYKKHSMREKARYDRNDWETKDDSAKLAVLPFIRRQDRCKTKTISDICKITKIPREASKIYTRKGRATSIIPTHYCIYLKNNKCYRLGYKEIIINEAV